MSLIVGEKNYGYSWRLLILLAMLCVISGDDNITLQEGDACTTLSDEEGICTIIWNCEIYMKGLRSKTIKYSSIFRCSFVGSDEVVCCPIGSNQTILANLTTATTPTSISLVTIPTPTSLVTEDSTTAPVTTGPNERPSQAACREWKTLDRAGLTFHILDGVPVPPGLYAHMAALLQSVQAGGKESLRILCGSSLINERYVLTAAHCVSNPLLLPTIVRFGVVSWNSDEIKPLDVGIGHIEMHPDYISSRRYHDIAVIQLLTKVNFSMYIRPVCLYSDMEDVDASKQLTVIGWGVTNTATRALSDELLMANVTTVPLNSCNQSHIDFGRRLAIRSRYSYSLDNGQYCAFDVETGRRDACQADSGGPLQLSENGVTNVIGIVSFGLSCGSIFLPSVYTRVAFYLDWIESIAWSSEILGTQNSIN